MAHEKGFDKLASWTAGIPDYEGFVFRRFDRLSARNLQHLESELASLEGKLEDLDREAAETGDIESSRARYNWTMFEETSKLKDTLGFRRMKVAQEISSKLKNYDEVLLLQSQIAAIKQPDKYQSAMVQKCFNMGVHPSEFLANSPRLLDGYDYSRLDNPRDLIALNSPPDPDFLSRFLRHHPGIIKSEILPSGEEYFNEKHITLAVSVANVVLVAVLLIGAVISLRRAQDEDFRIGLIAVFTVLFAATVGLLTNAKRGEIFASSAAYAAVLIVFISGDLGASNECQCILDT
ncbi:hypothetical protein ACJZ2D_009772 [Fusarium nematophilum]